MKYKEVIEKAIEFELLIADIEEKFRADNNADLRHMAAIYSQIASNARNDHRAAQIAKGRRRDDNK